MCILLQLFKVWKLLVLIIISIMLYPSYFLLGIRDCIR